MRLQSSPKVRKGQALVEYALLVVCVAVVCAVALSMLGHKTNDALAVGAAIMPGAHDDDNKPIVSANAIPTTAGANGLQLNTDALINKDRYEGILGKDGGAKLVTESSTQAP